MKSVFQINTVYQLFITINMRLHNMPEGECDLIVTDHTPALITYIEGLKESHLFNKVFYVKSLKFNKWFWGIHNDNKDKIFYDAENVLNGVLERAEIDYSKYDFIYLANLDAYSKFVYHVYTHLKIRLIEDGASICTNDWKSACEKWNYIEGFNKVYENVDKLYLYSPELMCIDLGYKMERLPKISLNNAEIIRVYNRIFSYDTSFRFPKFVFLEEPFAADNIKNNDLELMTMISKQVGYDNFFIKTHPRNIENRSKKLGIGKQKETPWPFELMLMNNMKENITYITIDSGALISTRAVFEEDVKTMFLYKIVKGDTRNIAKQEFVQYMDKFCKLYKSRNLLVPYSEYEMEKMLICLK